MSKLLRAALAGLLASGCLGFLLPPLPLSPTRFPAARGTFRLRAEAAGAEGGGAGHSKATNMRVSEIKSELDLRKVPYNDCFDKESLVERLMEARARGAADTDILNSFTKTNLESQFDQDLADRLNNVDEGALKDVISSDGTLPGGLTPEETLNMMKNPEMRALLQVRIDTRYRSPLPSLFRR